MTRVFGKRLLKGCLPPHDDPSKYNLYWIQLTEKTYLFFARAWGKSLNLWVPCDIIMRQMLGGTRLTINDYDIGKDGYHRVVIYGDHEDPDWELVLGIETGDHRSIQRWTWDQLSNYTSEETEINVE